VWRAVVEGRVVVSNDGKDEGLRLGDLWFPPIRDEAADGWGTRRVVGTRRKSAGKQKGPLRGQRAFVGW
jgi:hypothetical protein